MLKINKNIILYGVSEINGQQIVYMSATINTEGNNNTNTTKTITNKELYNANVEAARADMAAFESEVFKVEDEIKVGINNEVK